MKNNFLELFEKCSTELKELAFTHSSYAHDKGCMSNERVEFLGDSVLSTIVSDYLYKHAHQNEGKMSKVRSVFVCTDNLSNLANELNIMPRIKVGKSFKNKQISKSILADTIESMIGVMYLTYGIASISSAVLDALRVRERLSEGMRATDYKSELQEFCQNEKSKLNYTVDTYLTKGGEENFRANVFVKNDFIAYGQGSTKREAEQNAAKLALVKLKEKND